MLAHKIPPAFGAAILTPLKTPNPSIWCRRPAHNQRHLAAAPLLCIPYRLRAPTLREVVSVAPDIHRHARGRFRLFAKRGPSRQL